MKALVMDVTLFPMVTEVRDAEGRLAPMDVTLFGDGDRWRWRRR